MLLHISNNPYYLSINLVLANIYVLGRLHSNRPLIDSQKKVWSIILFFVGIILVSALLSILLYIFIDFLKDERTKHINK